MNNQKILKERWEDIDKKLSSFYETNNKTNRKFRDAIQDILDSIKFTPDEIYSYADIKYIAKLQKKIKDLKSKGKLKGYTGYLLDKLYKSLKLKNNEVLKGLFMVEMYKKNEEQEIDEMKLYKEVAQISYEIETKRIIKKKPEKEKHLSLPDAFIYSLLINPVYNGWKWTDYKDGNNNYYATMLYDKVEDLMNRNAPLDVYSPELSKVFDKEQRSYLNKKKDIIKEDIYIDEFYGSIDDVVCYIANASALKGIADSGFNKVQFVAVLDEATTDMCLSLDGQIFDIYEWNTYDRYSKADDKNVVYKTKGLKLGENLPPIDNGYHHCRSTIYPYNE